MQNTPLALIRKRFRNTYNKQIIWGVPAEALIVIEGVTKAIEAYETVLRKIALPQFANLETKTTVKEGEPITFRDISGKATLVPWRYKELHYKFEVKGIANSEFKSTFLFLINHYTHEGWDYVHKSLSKRRLQKFYRYLLHLDKIFSEYKAKALIPRLPKNVYVMDLPLQRTYREGRKTITTTLGGEYYPERDLGWEKEDVIVYMNLKNSLLKIQGTFVHELIHHIQNVLNLPHTENEGKMLKVAEKYIPNSFIPEIFKEYLARSS